MSYSFQFLVLFIIAALFGALSILSWMDKSIILAVITSLIFFVFSIAWFTLPVTKTAWDNYPCKQCGIPLGAHPKDINFEGVVINCNNERIRLEVRDEN